MKTVMRPRIRGRIRRGLMVDTRSKITETVLHESARYTITVKRTTILHRLGLKPSHVVITISPIVLGTLLKIARELSNFSFAGAEVLSQKDGTVDFLELGIKNIIQNNDKLVNVIALAITNTDAEPPKKLVKFLRENLSPADGREILSLIVDKMDVMDFLACTVLATRTMITKTGKKQISGDSSEA